MAMYNYYWPNVGYLEFDDERMTVMLTRCIEVEMKITWLDRIRLLFKGCK